MKIKETIEELSIVLLVGGFADDYEDLREILPLFDEQPNKARSRILRLFSSNNVYLEREFTRTPYPKRERDPNSIPKVKREASKRTQ